LGPRKVALSSSGGSAIFVDFTAPTSVAFLPWPGCSPKWGHIVKVQIGDWVLFTPHIAAVQHLQAVQSTLVHFIGGAKYCFIGDEAEALLAWARDGAKNIGELYPSTGQMKEAAKSHSYDWSGAAA
jgi:hypothetical protein